MGGSTIISKTKPKGREVGCSRFVALSEDSLNQAFSRTLHFSVIAKYQRGLALKRNKVFWAFLSELSKRHLRMPWTGDWFNKFLGV